MTLLASKSTTTTSVCNSRNYFTFSSSYLFRSIKCFLFLILLATGSTRFYGLSYAIRFLLKLCYPFLASYFMFLLLVLLYVLLLSFCCSFYLFSFSRFFPSFVLLLYTRSGVKESLKQPLKPPRPLKPPLGPPLPRHLPLKPPRNPPRNPPRSLLGKPLSICSWLAWPPYIPLPNCLPSRNPGSKSISRLWPSK